MTNERPDEANAATRHNFADFQCRERDDVSHAGISTQRCLVCRPEDADIPGPPTCSLCRRARTLGNTDHPMDAYDYTPMQLLTGQPLGWYSGDDGEVCPEDMEKTTRGGGL